MESVNPKLIVILLGVIALFAYIKITNPHQKYRTTKYWQSATLEDVYHIPEEALLPGNKNGPVLMWAASATNNPEIISALIDRGMDVNEREVDFNGTALSAAAYQNQNSAIIDALVEHGAHVNIILGKLKKSPLLLAAEKNNLSVTKRLLAHGADLAYTDVNGKTALMLAEEFGNKQVYEFYKQKQ